MFSSFLALKAEQADVNLPYPLSELLFHAKSNPKEALNKLAVIQLNTISNPITLAQFYLVESIINRSLINTPKALEAIEKGLLALKEAQDHITYKVLRLELAKVYDHTGDLTKALSITNDVLIWAKTHKAQHLLIDAYFTRGVIQTSKNNYVSALADLQIAYDLAPVNYETNWQSIIVKGDIASSIALVYEYRNEDSLSLPYFQTAVEHHSKNSNLLELSISLYGLGKANKNIGRTKLGQSLLNKSLQISEKIGDEQGVAYALNEMASINIQQNDLEHAIEQLNRALVIFSKVNNHFMLLNVTSSLSSIYLKKEELTQARQYLKQAKSYLKKEGMQIHRLNLQSMESEILAAEKAFEKAYLLLSSVSKNRHELARTQSAKLLHQLRASYELESKTKANQLLQQTNQLQQVEIESNLKYRKLLTGLIIFMGLSLLLATLLIWRSKKHKRVLQKLSITDDLTGLNNKRFMMQSLNIHIEHAKYHKAKLSIALIDIDHFKLVNDTHGHVFGDKVLQYFSQQCISQIRETDIIGRVGGEEFLLILPDTDLKGAIQLCNKLKDNVHKNSKTLKDDFEITVSIGIKQYPIENQVLQQEAFYKQVDEALYSAKQSGRNLVRSS